MTGILQSLLGSVSTAVSVVTDAYFNLVTLLLPGNGTNGAQNNTFLDSSSNNFTITRNGNTTQGTFSPFSQTGWSSYFGGSGNYLQGDITTFAASSTSTFTIEFWYYPTSFAATSPIIGDMQPAGSINYISAQIDTTGKPALYWYDGNAQTCTAQTALTLNTWNYVAIRVSSNAISIYVNSTSAATLVGTTTLTGRTGQANYAIGQFSTTQNTSGYVSNVRVSTIARTISSVPTVAFTSDADTRILALSDNRFVAYGSVASTLTPTGSAMSIQAFSPFAPTAAYSAATVGGSGYFDGTGDTLSIANNAALNVGSGNFCIEAWFYLSSTTVGQVIVSNAGAFGSDNTQIDTDANSNVRFASSATVWLTSSGTVTRNSWNHVAVSRSGTTLSMFVNGARQATATNSTNFANANNYAFAVGAAPGYAAQLTGYVSNIRVVKGSSVYDPTQTTITLPTAPLTAVTNTSLLLNFTNAGITDATAKNDLETVGNAQISTTQSKFGGSSMYFDGTGDYLKGAYSPNMILSGDFTIECWLNFSAHGNYAGIVSFANSNTSNPPTSGWAFNFYSTTDRLYFETGTGFSLQATNAVTTNQWNHVAIVRSGSTITHYLNGTANGSGTSSATFAPLATDNFVIGIERGLSGTITGYIDDLRISRYARYTGNFTPPTAAFPLQ